ncbi:MAG: polysaccharide biosynthesis protein [Eubacteriaceae bacterium]|jgi:FlaA1/EpsC-like NDP-sugar epimerase|nr:polysaccharide biosynthesis protein [Eubacteriaceae bacterium]
MDRLGRKKKYIVLAVDVVLCVIAYIFSYILADDQFTTLYFLDVTFYIPLIIAIISTVCIFVLFDIYNIIWSYINIKELFHIIIASLISTGILVIVVYMFKLNIRLRACLLFMATFTLAVVLSRMTYYLLRHSLPGGTGTAKRKRLLIIGGGEASSIILREMVQNRKSEYVPVGVIDDEKGKQGRSILGVKILGTTNQIAQIVDMYGIDSIVFAIVNISEAKRKKILDACVQVCSDVKIVPGIYGSLKSVDELEIVPNLKNLTMDDLLFRDSVSILRREAIHYIKEKVVLVTGGGGSIGSELCMQIATLAPRQLIIFDIYENNVYSLQQKLKHKYGDKLDFSIEIASIRDSKKLEHIIKKYRPQVIFHAAAHKHVPLMETNPEEAVKNNVEGTRNIALLAQKYEVERFVLISTDKAVNPTNVMGATKRICEKIILASAQNSQKTIFSAVRFGNVLGSSGSVIPLFKEQLEKGGPLTVTDPEVTRYFMTIPEAVSLVILTGELASGGEIFVLDMGKPVKIKDLAENLIRLAGKIPYRDIDIEFIGLRPGEKLYEELLVHPDELQRTIHEKIFIEKVEKINAVQLRQDIKKLVDAARVNDTEKVRCCIKTIVPEYSCELLFQISSTVKD